MIDLAALQGIVNQFMTDTVTIRHRATVAKDPSNRAGDGVPGWGDTITVQGWFVDQPTKQFTQGGGFDATTTTTIIRVPVGTVVGPRDEVTLKGTVYTVVDTTSDETWPVMTRVTLVQLA